MWSLRVLVICYYQRHIKEDNMTRYKSIDSYAPIHQKSDTSLLTYLIKMSTIASKSKIQATSLSFTLFQSYVYIFKVLNLARFTNRVLL
jgi:hypothetical protein